MGNSKNQLRPGLLCRQHLLDPFNTFRDRASRWIVTSIVAVIVLVVACITNVAPVSAFNSLERIHKRITRNALTFITPDVVETIADGNQDEDEGDAAELTERHQQNCRFRDSAEYVNMRYRQVVEALLQPSSDDPGRAARLFGHILHGVQDFYSHSNWIPKPPEGLGIRGRIFDSGLGFWPTPEPYSNIFDDVMIIEGDPPKGVTVLLPTDANGRVSSAVPIVTDRRRIFEEGGLRFARRPQIVVTGRVFRGLMTSVSGTTTNKGNQFCPPVGDNCKSDSPDNVCLRHGEGRSESDGMGGPRAFDDEGHMNLDHEGGGDWFDARHYAKLQTQHEWCRLLHLSRQLDPTFRAAGRLLGTWVKAGPDVGLDTPHIPGTACARGVAKRHLVEISATLTMGAPRTSSFVVFRGDFTSSARTTMGPNSTKTLKICGNTNDSIVADLNEIVTKIWPPSGPARVPAQGPKIVVQVPSTARAWSIRDNTASFEATFDIKVTPNVC